MCFHIGLHTRMSLCPGYVLNFVSYCFLLTTFNTCDFVSIPTTTTITSLPVPTFAFAFPSDWNVCPVIFLGGFFCDPGLRWTELQLLAKAFNCNFEQNVKTNYEGKGWWHSFYFSIIWRVRVLNPEFKSDLLKLCFQLSFCSMYWLGIKKPNPLSFLIHSK